MVKHHSGLLISSLFLAAAASAAGDAAEKPVPPLTPNSALIKAARPQAAAALKTARVVEESIAVSEDGLLSFKVKANNYPEKSFVEVSLESGTVFEVDSGSYTDPKFQKWQSNTAKVLPNQTAEFMFSLRGLYDGYVRIRIPKYEAPGVAPTILTFPIQGAVKPCGRGTSAGHCRILHGYQGAGRN